MTCILSWNIQNGKNLAGDISLERIAGVIEGMGTADVICLQEVSRGLTLSAAAGAPDQIAELGTLFPDYEVVFGAGVDALSADGEGRWQFGNAVLSRLPLLSVLPHPLPRPGVQDVRHMMRQATEVVVAAAGGPLRIVNLHLEFHSAAQRMAQVDRLRELQREAIEEQRLPPRSDPSGPYQAVPRPVDSVFCGDFNMLCDSVEYRRMLAPMADEAGHFKDAWSLIYPHRSHAPTCGVHDRVQWPEGPHCRDFFFVAGACVESARDLRVDTVTDASDHQPLLLELADAGG